MSTPRAATVVMQAWAWGGGALFVTALAVYARFFLILATPASGGGSVAVAIGGNIALFTLFAAHHSLMARTGAKAWLMRHVPPSLERSVYVWVASVLLIAVCVLWTRVPGLVYELAPPASWLGYAVQGAGMIVTMAGARVLDALELAGIRQTRQPAPEAPAEIRVVWPFTMVRHPIYLGWALIAFGAPTMTLDRLVWAVVSTFYLVIAMPWEERSLSAAAGPAYSAYQRRVRWRMVPWVY